MSDNALLTEKKTFSGTVLPVCDKTGIRAFLSVPDAVYRGDDKYTPHVIADLKKTLSRLLLAEKTYRALVAIDAGKPVARVLYTVDKNKQLGSDRCGFFSLYECIDDPAVSFALLSAMKEDLLSMGAEYISGSFSPFDPDNRRGIMVKGFERAPLIFTSYNPPYYADQLTSFGLEKEIDTYQYTIPLDDESLSMLRKMAAFAKRHCDFRIEPVRRETIERDIRDFTAVMTAATNEINYQEAPSEEEIRKIFCSWKHFLNLDLILIAREGETGEPIGMVMGIPDYFELFRKTHGKSGPVSLLRMLLGKKKIRSMRATLQYVVPAYQTRGVIAALGAALIDNLFAAGFDYVEAGTILENNRDSQSVMKILHGELSRVYRIYTQKL